jgi:Fe-S cluster biogenesis protein NfuA/nitrite reductase/ring-hydroxylating ferredoxin subunit
MSTFMATAVTPKSDLQELAERVDQAVAEVRTLDAPSPAKAMAMKNAIEEFHKLGLIKMVQRLKSDDRGRELLFELAEDPTVYALFSMHNLVKADLRTRVARVIEMVRPYMQSHGGDVELVEVTSETVFLRLKGSCNGCSLSSVTLRNGVEEALKQHVPEIQHIEVVPAEPEAQFVPLDALRAPEVEEPGWVAGPLASDVMEGVPFRMDFDKGSLLLVKFRSQIQAFKNECAHLGLPLDGATLNSETGVLTCNWHGFRYNCQSGECITAPEAQLEALPLRVQNGRVKVRVP